MPAPSSRLNSIIILLVLLALVAISPVFVAAQDAGSQNCAATPDQILGQAFSRFAGAEGETSENGITAEGEDIEEFELAADPTWISENLRFAEGGTEPVAILIVDDFSIAPPEEPSEEPMPLDVSHGWLVYDVFNALLESLPEADSANIELAMVDISGAEGYRSDFIVAQIEETIDTLTAVGIERFVLNMSFVFVPCRDEDRGFDYFEFLERHSEDRTHSIIAELGNDRDYVAGLLSDPRVTSIEEDSLIIDEEPGRGQPANAGPPEFVQEQLQVFQLFEDNRLQNDALRDFLRRSDHFIVPVASAGNFKWRRPFFPARWGEVISVSASEGNDLGRWLHSNDGEIMAPGAWFRFSDGEFRAGTSFAAPVVSFLLALDLTQDTPICGFRGTAPALVQRTFNNTPLLEAVADSCG